ncbi:MAG TPA: hypothetical protein VGB24_03130 [Longimicrobium sp.]|uniref:hypothetical protein n=1 Tax=Longimicrobium sp. TaxID=2029185 RepID=UPI002ED8AF5A
MAAFLAVVCLVVLFAGRGISANGLRVPTDHAQLGYARELSGRSVRFVTADTAVVLLFTTAECVACLIGGERFRHIHDVLTRSGVAFRTVVGSPTAGAMKFRPLIPGEIVVDSAQAYFRMHNIKVTPAIVVLGGTGTRIAEWAPVPLDPTLPNQILSHLESAGSTRDTDLPMTRDGT